MSSKPSTLFDRIASLIRTRSSGKQVVARIRLDPPELGQVRVHLRLNGNTLRVRLATQTAEARDTLLSRSSDLQSALERQGIQVQRMDFVSPAGSSGSDASGLATGEWMGGARQSPEDPNRSNDDAWRAAEKVDGGLSSGATDWIEEDDDDAPWELAGTLHVDVRV